MATNDVVDPAQDAEQRAERAKASLLSRVELLKHKLIDAKHKLSDAKEMLDLPAQISKHAVPAVAIAFALGVAAGLRRPGSAGDHGVPTARGAVWSAIAALGMRALREIALVQLGRVAKQWWDDQGNAELAGGQPPPPAGGDPFIEP